MPLLQTSLHLYDEVDSDVLPKFKKGLTRVPDGGTGNEEENITAWESSFVHYTHFYVAPEVEAGPSVLPSLSPFSGEPSSLGFVAEASNDCSKSAMISSMCSVPTDMRIRSYK